MWFEEKRVSLFVGKGKVLKCHTLGSPTPSVKWLKGGKELRALTDMKHGGHYPKSLQDDFNNTFSFGSVESRGPRGSRGTIISTLKFSTLELGHAGTYTCEVRNTYYTRRQSITVSVSCEFLIYFH